MRRKDRELDQQQAYEILDQGEYGILSTCSSEGQPYGVPLSYVRIDNMIYFHTAKDGHKIQNLKQNPKVCFTVVGKTQPVYNGSFTTLYESAAVFGTVEAVEPEDLKRSLLLALCEKYLPGRKSEAEEEISRYAKVTDIYGICINSISGKANKGRTKPD